MALTKNERSFYMGVWYNIKGGRSLRGEISVAGNKNAVLPIMAATLLTDQECLLTNVPLIRDVIVMGEILQDLGASVGGLGTNRLKIRAKKITKTVLDPFLVSKLRASVLLMGPLLARMGQVSMRHPGGCVIGRRSVETHLVAFQKMGAKVRDISDGYTVRMPKYRSGRVFLKESSVTATENIFMLAAGFNRETVIENAACEPHVRNLGEFLVLMGVKVQGLGSNKLLVEGLSSPKGATISIVPDQIEVGTWAIASAVTRGEVKIMGVIEADLDMILGPLSQMGVNLKMEGSDLIVLPSVLKVPVDFKIQTRPWPGFPTDLMSPFVVLATQAQGTTLCHDWMYESRMFFVDKLIQMGAQIVLCDPHRALITGPAKLRGKELESPDIRAGMALVIAALCAEGESRINNANLVERGYEMVDQRLRLLGAQIERFED
ncbi:UDP-N-acetylglucosamine 1-carboxyvinyltransferase [Patescibacteria group bacterium]|nr:UDP-N-acetylglucosamine 1-carboxyvinyltransferase [Patescibacteria group bacterium]